MPNFFDKYGNYKFKKPIEIVLLNTLTDIGDRIKIIFTKDEDISQVSIIVNGKEVLLPAAQDIVKLIKTLKKSVIYQSSNNSVDINTLPTTIDKFVISTYDRFEVKYNAYDKMITIFVNNKQYLQIGDKNIIKNIINILIRAYKQL